MLVAGAKRHAKEVLQILEKENNIKISFFDDISDDLEDLLYSKYKILKSTQEAKKYFETENSKFILALGNPILRKILAIKLKEQGGSLESVIAKTSEIGNHEVFLGNGINVMHQVMISNNVNIGEGSLINAFSSIHHDVNVGEYCEVSPHAVLLGGCSLGNLSSIGSNATILPNVRVGNNVVIGAGSVVTKDVPDNCLVVGVPAKVIKYIEIDKRLNGF